MTHRILITGSADYSNEEYVSSMLESEFRLAVGQVIEIHDRTEGVLHEIVAEVVADYAHLGLTFIETPGPVSIAIAFLTHCDNPPPEFDAPGIYRQSILRV